MATNKMGKVYHTKEDGSQHACLVGNEGTICEGDWQLGRVFYRYQSEEDVSGGAGKAKKEEEETKSKQKEEKEKAIENGATKSSDLPPVQEEVVNANGEVETVTAEDIVNNDEQNSGVEDEAVAKKKKKKK